MSLSLAIGCDHAAFALKDHLVTFLKNWGHEVHDFGTFGPESVDYPHYAQLVSKAVQAEQVRFGILLCGSGVGVSIAANRFPGVRAVNAWNGEIAALSRQHNDANILCLGARFIAPYHAERIVEAFLTADFEGGKHQRRVAQIDQV